MKRYFFTSIFLMLFSYGFSQEIELGFQGVVVDEHNTPISDVLISVNWSRKGLLSKLDGSFYIKANVRDTLVFKHVSFEPKAIALQNIQTNTLKVQLTRRTNILDEVTVSNWGTWQEFKQKIANMNADSIRNTDDYRLEMMFGAKRRHPVKNPYFRAMKEARITPATVIFNGLFGGDLINMLRSKSLAQKLRREIQNEKLQELSVQKNAYRYSEKLIANTLKIKGKELKSFKIYCDYELDFTQSDYNLTKQIFELYKKWKTQPDLTESDSVPSKSKLDYLPIQKF